MSKRTDTLAATKHFIGGHDEPLLSYVFTVMLILSDDVLTHYRGDLFHDAQTLAETFPKGTKGGTFRWCVGTSHTAFAADEATWETWLAQRSVPWSTYGTWYEMRVVDEGTHGSNSWQLYVKQLNTPEGVIL